jgi:uncharacterized membrane protein (UPF0127 family)
MKLKINNKIYNVTVVSAPEDLKAGLNGKFSIAKDEGMLFNFPHDGFHSMWMKDCGLHLDIIFIDEDGVVTKVSEGKPYDDRLLNGQAQYVLEVRYKSGIKKGDVIDIDDDELDDETEDEKDEDEYKMMLLDNNGDEQYKLKSGERIFSRPSTATIVRKSRIAWRNRKTDSSDKLYASLGRYVFNEIEAQDNRKPEYVKAK